MLWASFLTFLYINNERFVKIENFFVKFVKTSKKALTTRNISSRINTDLAVKHFEC